MAGARLLCVLATTSVAHALLPPDQFRHDQLTGMQSAFSRFGAQGVGGAIEMKDLPNFLRYVVSSMNSAELSPKDLSARATELTRQLLDQLPPNAARFSLSDVMEATGKILLPPPLPPPDDDPALPAGVGSKQLRLLRKKLARNRLTMPLFDTRGWVRDFEKALKIQWEIYSNGFSPMHIDVARSDRLYGIEPVL